MDSESQMQDNGQQSQRAESQYWADETVDAIGAFVVVTCLVLMAMWYVIS